VEAHTINKALFDDYTLKIMIVCVLIMYIARIRIHRLMPSYIPESIIIIIAIIIREMIPVLMIELVSLMFHWTKNKINFGKVTNEEQS